MLPRGTLLRGLVPHLRLPGASTSALGGRHISTLDPARLTSADFLDLSGQKKWAIKPGRDVVHFVSGGGSGRVAFPEETQGFLYYAPGPAHAPIAGEVRFRTTTGPDPADFARGRDLLLPNMPVPWSIPLLNMLATEKYQHLREVLISLDGSASAELVACAQQHKGTLVTQKSRVIHSLGQPFIQDLSASATSVRFASGHRIGDIMSLHLPSDNRGGKTVRPYNGQIKCCFEARTIDGIQSLTLRVLEIVEPVKPKREDYDGWIPPAVAGELLKTKGGRVWKHMLRESNTTIATRQAMVSRAPTAGYVIRGPSHSGSAREAGAPMLRCTRNLAPTKLDATDWMDLSLRRDQIINLHDEASGTRGTIASVIYSPRRPPFPRDTTGFLYLYVPDPDHPIGAQLRFRVVPEPDPTAFAAGHDLRTEDGAVWNRWLPPILPQQLAGDALSRIITRQGLVNHAVMNRWRTAVEISKATGQLVCPGSEPLTWDLAKRYFRVIIGTGWHARRVMMHSPFVYRERAAPFKGRVMVRMEEDPLKKTFHLRVHKVLSLEVTPEHDRTIPVPEEGATVRLASGPRLWKLTQEMRERR